MEFLACAIHYDFPQLGLAVRDVNYHRREGERVNGHRYSASAKSNFKVMSSIINCFIRDHKHHKLRLPIGLMWVFF